MSEVRQEKQTVYLSLSLFLLDSSGCHASESQRRRERERGRAVRGKGGCARKRFLSLHSFFLCLRSWHRPAYRHFSFSPSSSSSSSCLLSLSRHLTLPLLRYTRGAGEGGCKRRRKEKKRWPRKATHTHTLPLIPRESDPVSGVRETRLQPEVATGSQQHTHSDTADAVDLK